MRSILLLVFTAFGLCVSAQESFEMMDIFQLQYANDVQISPNGKHIVYRKMGFDLIEDRATGNLWIYEIETGAHYKLTPFDQSESSPRWSPNGDRIAFTASGSKGSEIYIYWVAQQSLARITQLSQSPSNLSWSPTGEEIAFSSFVPEAPPIVAKIPVAPKGAKWAPKPRITDRLKHEADGRGYMPPGFTHIFKVSASGGAVRQLTEGRYNHRGPISWSAEGNALFFSGNRSDDWEYDFRNSEIYTVSSSGGKVTAVTHRDGPDGNATVSPDGKKIAYLGYTDKREAFQNTQLHIMNLDGADIEVISDHLDIDISAIAWDAKSQGLYISYDHHGNGKIAHLSLGKKLTPLAENLGGTSLGRPYGSGMFSVSNNGTLAFTHSTPDHPAELAIVSKGKTRRLTNLNKALFEQKTLGKVEEVWYHSSIDGRNIQGWVVYPPNYDATKKYPVMVENHGGPILNYGDRFSIEMQLFASAGYIVFYPNPRGSTSYGEEFANLLLNNYPGEDYNDVMDGVDALIEKGIAHEDGLFVTGGSAGGIMSAWMIGKNNRFEAAAVVKPVMNWISKLLVADNYYGYANTRYPGQVWENPMNYWNFSPISLVGNIETPTLVMVGMEDLRTPPSEAKQLYHALKLRKKETVLVEIPEASHGIANRPSNLMTKVAHVVAWFDKYRNW